MRASRKTGQLQIRVSHAQKAAIRRQADRAGMSMSEWILRTLVPPVREAFHELVGNLARSDHRAYALAELNDLLTRLSAYELGRAVSEAPRAALDPYWANYVAATVEHAAATKGTDAPSWTAKVPPLDAPVFGSSLKSLRLHLLTHAPPAFRRRNIFIDSSIGARV